MVAIAPVQARTTEKSNLLSLASLRRIQAGEEDTKSTMPENEKPEVLLFGQKQQFAKALPTATSIHTPVAEQAKATAVSVTPLFDFGKSTSAGERNIAQTALFTSSNIATSSGLTSPEKNSGSGDKKDGGNQYLSAHKTLNDVRLEALEKDDDILGSIMGNVC